MSTITFREHDRLRVGDWAYLKVGGHRCNGDVYERNGRLVVGHTIVVRPDGSMLESVEFDYAVREVPDLPTKLGSVILVHEVAGMVYDPDHPGRPAFLCDVDGEARWCMSDGFLQLDKIRCWSEADVISKEATA